MFIKIVLIASLLQIASNNSQDQAQLLLKSGFEPPVRVTGDMSDIVGADQGTHLGWETTSAWIASSRFAYLVRRDKKLTDYMASFITETKGPFGRHRSFPG